MWYTVIIEHEDEDGDIEYQTIRMELNDHDYEVIKRLCDQSDGRIYVEVG